MRPEFSHGVVRTIAVAALLAAACGGTTTDSPGSGVAVAVVPVAARLLPGESTSFAAAVTGSAVTAVVWTVQEAGGGVVDGSGRYTAPSTTGTFHVVASSAADPRVSGTAVVTVTSAPLVAVSVAPRTASLSTGGTVTFVATVTGSTNIGATWSVPEGAAGGTVTAAGVYTAPPVAGTYHVVATSNADSTKSDVAVVTVTSAPLVAVSVAPRTASLSTGGTVTFVATVTGSTNIGATWSVQEGAAGGTVTAAGVYTAPPVAGTYHVVATSNADSTKSDVAVVTVTSAPLVAVSVAPRTASLSTGGTVTFVATVTGSTNIGATWSVQEGAAGGTVTAAGVYTAPPVAGTYHVVATSNADSTKSDVAVVTVSNGTRVVGLAAQLQVLAQQAIFFDHASVGENVMDGVKMLLDSNAGVEPVRLTQNAGPLAGTIAIGTWEESSHLWHWNGDPAAKLLQFHADLDGGIGARLAATSKGIAIVKFCFDDFNGALGPAAMFSAYQSTMAAVAASYPDVRFVHMTAPLTTQFGNATRNSYNALMRSNYGSSGRLFDLAAVESTKPDGTQQTAPDGQVALVPGYSNDGGHLNATGQELVGRALVDFLANMP